MAPARPRQRAAPPWSALLAVRLGWRAHRRVALDPDLHRAAVRVRGHARGAGGGSGLRRLVPLQRVPRLRGDVRAAYPRRGLLPLPPLRPLFPFLHGLGGGHRLPAQGGEVLPPRAPVPQRHSRGGDPRRRRLLPRPAPPLPLRHPCGGAGDLGRSARARPRPPGCDQRLPRGHRGPPGDALQRPVGSGAPPPRCGLGYPAPRGVERARHSDPPPVPGGACSHQRVRPVD
mmetsp:Transcript_14295/g.42038  ORF Transcript_14295/g.42038 Transcript_14295/m.42038 type:complete len:230 (-) Transcript_14295:1358-2047(-)